ncbi:MAG: hypothetical protein JSS91_06940 [Bacteroidetes bacterium]|nr:hypothetical protein [Bacteroidota bacterium]
MPQGKFGHQIYLFYTEFVGADFSLRAGRCSISRQVTAGFRLREALYKIKSA